MNFYVESKHADQNLDFLGVRDKVRGRGRNRDRGGSRPSNVSSQGHGLLPFGQRQGNNNINNNIAPSNQKKDRAPGSQVQSDGSTQNQQSSSFLIRVYFQICGKPNNIAQ